LTVNIGDIENKNHQSTLIPRFETMLFKFPASRTWQTNQWTRRKWKV